MLTMDKLKDYIYLFLRCRIENYTPDLPWQEVRRVIADAFKVWSDVTDLTFTEVMNTKADIMIKFASKYHKDGYPFDGKGNGQTPGGINTYFF
jgi:hypothetical protein